MLFLSLFRCVLLMFYHSRCRSLHDFFLSFSFFSPRMLHMNSCTRCTNKRHLNGVYSCVNTCTSFTHSVYNFHSRLNFSDEMYVLCTVFFYEMPTRATIIIFQQYVYLFTTNPCKLLRFMGVRTHTHTNTHACLQLRVWGFVLSTEY